MKHLHPSPASEASAGRVAVAKQRSGGGRQGHRNTTMARAISLKNNPPPRLAFARRPSPQGGGLSHMLPAWLPPPERGRVGVGVDSTMWSAAARLSNWRSETPSRLAALADLPLSGGGEEPLASNAIPFGGRERSAKAGVETENNKSHHGEGKGG